MTRVLVPTFLHDGMGHAVKPNEGANSTEDVINPDDHTVIKQTDERITCPICGETFVDFWNDDEEEWMYKNAVMESNKIYHATCHADAVKGGTLADNLNNISLKRKLEDENQPEVSLIILPFLNKYDYSLFLICLCRLSNSALNEDTLNKRTRDFFYPFVIINICT